MINLHDARTLAAAWATALAHSVEGVFARLLLALRMPTRIRAAWLWLKAAVAAYERRAVLRLHAPAMIDHLKALHARVELLERRGFEGESAVARSVGTFLAKFGESTAQSAARDAVRGAMHDGSTR